MKVLFGTLIMIFGVLLGIYIGVWIMFIGGIVQIINAIKATPVEAMPIALGVARMVCASIVGSIIAFGSIAIGRIVID